MASMKKHSLIQVDFQSSVKLSPAEAKKIQRWLSLAAEVMEQLIREHKIVHASWIRKAAIIRVSVLLCGESRIKKLNHEYRNKNKVTDVLSFPTYSSLRTKREKEDFISSEIFLGDLAICHQRTSQQAKQFKISYWDEFIHLFMHGMIHLLGYDHEISGKEEKLMQKWESLGLDIFSAAKKKGALKRTP